MCEDPLEAEVRACLGGIEIALEYSQLPIDIDMDCFHLTSSLED
jgi:hypothetical protein